MGQHSEQEAPVRAMNWLHYLRTKWIAPLLVSVIGMVAAGYFGEFGRQFAIHERMDQRTAPSTTADARVETRFQDGPAERWPPSPPQAPIQDRPSSSAAEGAAPTLANGALQWEVSTPRSGTADANATLARLVRTELERLEFPASGGLIARLWLQVEDTSRVPPPGGRQTYRVGLYFDGLPGGDCHATVLHSEYRGSATDPVFAPEDFDQTIREVSASAKRYVSSGGRACT